jgi:predicted RNA-binding Zn-ribbon protein involved in translation (DUF1610 family)
MVVKNLKSKRKYICPNCGKRSMVRIENPKNQTYMLVCEKCQTKRGPLPIRK